MKNDLYRKDFGTWENDPIFFELAGRIAPTCLTTSPQYPGDVKFWNPQWKSCLPSEPSPLKIDYTVPSIIRSASKGDWSMFVLQVGLWGNMIPGTMGKSHRKIYGVTYGDCPNQDRFNIIHASLNKAHQSMVTSRSLEEIWLQLRGDLDWSAVMISKCLHFMARSAGWIEPIPVPIDNAMVRKWLWPAFKNAVKNNGIVWPRPGGVNGDSWKTYNRYMSAIRGWAEVQQKSCMDIENSLFDLWRRESNRPPDFAKSPR